MGAYGHPQAVIRPVPARQPIPIGVWAHKRKPGAYEDDELIKPDEDIIAAFEQSIVRADGDTED